MASQNIQIGIDLGTTNSEVAVNVKGQIEIVKDIWQNEYTPSVFGFDKSKNKVVGKKAYEKLFKDGSPDEEKNYKSEIKRLIGTSECVTFPNSGDKLNAEEISAEILKSLREDVQRKYEDVSLSSAVITVPAYFSTVQKEATKRAGNMAGFQHVILLQEPISAAISYGFINSKNESVLVYDLGGGTFDVALVTSKDGVLSVLNQNGDNFLGGKDIDNLLVDEIIIPNICKKYPELKEISRSQKEYKAVFARLKYIAEKAKIELTQLVATYLEIDITDKSLNTKDNNIYLNFELSRNELEELVIPLINKTIVLVNKTIKDSGFKQDQIKKIVLVGGPTQMPLVRKMLEDKVGVAVDRSSDPLTTVSRGAAIFALSQKIPQGILDKNNKSDKEEIILDINYDGLTSDDDQLITGVVKTKIDDGYYLQIQSEGGYFNSPEVPILNSKFKTTIRIEPDKSNIYWIYLFDKNGDRKKVSPDSMSITHGLTVNSAQLSHPIGLAVISRDEDSREEMALFFHKGDRLPQEKKRSFHTARRLKKDDSDNLLNIYFLEGESINPENNIYIAEAGIKGSDIPFDIPEGSDIDITIKVDESNILSAEWYLPMIDKSGDIRATLMDESISTDGLKKLLEDKIQKAATIKENCSDDEKDAIEERIADITKSLSNAETDDDSKRKANKDLKELGQGLDELEKSSEIPQLKEEFKKGMDFAKELITEIGIDDSKQEDNKELNDLSEQGARAITDDDRIMLKRTIDQVRQLSIKIFWASPQSWIHHFNELKKSEHKFSNKEDALYYIDKGEKAVEAGDIVALKASVTGLESLIPSEEAEIINKKLSGIM